MSKTNLALMDGRNVLKNIAVEDNGTDGLMPYHCEDSLQRSALLSAINATTAAVQVVNTGLATTAKQDSTITAINAITTAVNNMSAAHATAVKQDSTITAINAITTAVQGVSSTHATAVKQDSTITAINAITTALAAILKAQNYDSSGLPTQLGGVNVTGTLTAASDGTTNPTTGIGAVARVRGDFNINVVVSSDFSGSYVIERKFTTGGGTNWHALTALGNVVSFTTSMSELFSEPAAGVDYRLRVTSLSAGTVTGYRICQ